MREPSGRKFTMERCPGCAAVGRKWNRSRYEDGTTACRFCARDASRARFAMVAGPGVALCAAVLAAMMIAHVATGGAFP